MKKERNIKKYYVPILYIIIYPFLLCVMVLFRIQIKKNKIKVQKGSLIIANHQSKIDAFLIMYAFGIRNIMTLMPCLYPVTHVYMNKKIVGLLLSLFGAYSMGENSIEKAKALLYTEEMLRKGYTVLLFPEGAISTHKNDDVDMSLFKKGMYRLIEKEIPLILVRVRGMYSFSLRDVFFGKQSKSISYAMTKQKDDDEPNKDDLLYDFFA